MPSCYRPQTKFAKVVFLHVSVCPQGGMHGRGACMAGIVCVVGVCMAWGACIAGGMNGGGPAL